MVTSNFLLYGQSNLVPMQTTTVSATSELPAKPASNLRRPYYSSGWRGLTGVYTASVIVNLGTPKTFSAFTLAGFKGSAFVTKEVTLSNAADFSVVISHVGPVAAFDTSLATLGGIYYPPFGLPLSHTYSVPVTAQYIKLTIVDPSPRFTFIGASFFVIDSWWQPGINIDATWTKNDLFSGDPTSRKVLRSYKVTFHRVTSQEENQLLTLQRNLTDQGKIVVIPQPQSPERHLSDAIVCNLSGPISSAFLDDTGKFRIVQVGVTECEE